MSRIDLNADAGESFGAWNMGNDPELVPWITTLNVACGFHGGDPLTIQRTLALARQHGTAVGAHPGYPDLVGFGRRILEASPAEVYADVLYQIGALDAFCRVGGLKLGHVKAHGALSTRAWTHPETAAAIAQATHDYNPLLPLLVLPGTHLAYQAEQLGVPVVIEAFPERAYLSDGRLAPRSLAGSSIHDPQEAARRAVEMVLNHRVAALDGGWFDLHPQTLCIHGDNPQAVAIARSIRQALEAEGIEVVAFQ